MRQFIRLKITSIEPLRVFFQLCEYARFDHLKAPVDFFLGFATPRVGFVVLNNFLDFGQIVHFRFFSDYLIGFLFLYAKAFVDRSLGWRWGRPPCPTGLGGRRPAVSTARSAFRASRGLDTTRTPAGAAATSGG